MKRWGLTAKTIVAILLPTLIIFGIMIFCTYRLTSKAMEEQAFHSLEQSTERRAGEINLWLSRSEFAVKTAGDVIGSGAGSPETVLNVLQTVKTQNPDLMNIFVGYNDGKVIDALQKAASVDARQRPWFQGVTSDQPIYTDVYDSISVGKRVITVAYPLKVNGQKIGVIAGEINLEHLSQIAANVKVAQTGYAAVLSSQGKFLYHPTLQITDNILTVDNGTLSEYGKKFLSGEKQLLQYHFRGDERFVASSPIGYTGMVVFLSVPSQELLNEIRSLTWLNIAISIVGMVLLALLIAYVIRRLIQVLSRISNRFHDMAQGDYTVNNSLVLQLADDELGELYNSAKHMFQEVRSLIESVHHSSEQIAASSEELTASADQSAQVSGAVSGVVDAMNELVSRQAGEIEAIVHKVSQKVTVSNEMVTTSQSVRQTSLLAADKAQEGAEAMNSVVTQMHSIEQSVQQSAEVVTQLGRRSQEIGQIVETISGIAGQTNLLALNAAIEAARAGEQGRGFAVVADEVRKLAEQSAEAAKQIEQLIHEIQADTDRAVMAMEQGTQEVTRGDVVIKDSKVIFADILTLVRQATTEVDNISQTVKAAALTDEQVLQGMKDLAALGGKSGEQTRTVAEATKEQTASSHEIASASQSLAKIAQGFQESLMRFKI